MKDLPKHILGFLTGFTFFIVLIPFGLYELARHDFIFHGREMISSDTLRYALFAVFFSAGVVFAAWSNISLVLIGKGGPTEAFGISVSPRTKKLVVRGPYRYTRNPMVLGAFLLYASVVILSNSLIGLPALALLFSLIVAFLKGSEEKRLIRDFGDEYLDYRKKVPMIFPFRIFRKH